MTAVPRRLLPLVLALAAGCQQLRVEPFRGSWISLTMTWPLQQPMPMGPPQPVLLPDGEHLELWAQLASGQVVRLLADEEREPARFPGFDVRPALSPNDPCLIRGLNPDDACASSDRAECGAHLLSADAQRGDTPAARELEQQAVVQHVRQVVSAATAIVAAGGVRGKAPVPLLVLTRHDPGGRAEAPALTLTAENAGSGAEAAERLQRCRAFAAAHRNYYLGNPRQLTKPLHGDLYGFFNFSTTTPELPPQNFGSIVVTTLTPLGGLRGLLLTRETDAAPAQPSADPGRRVVTGMVLPESAAGRGAIRLALIAMLPTGPMGMLQPVTVGTASVLTGLDEGLP